VAYPPIRGQEWSLPAWYLESDFVDEVLYVHKILENPYWMKALLDSLHPAKIVHNLRRPKEYLASWYRRYVPRRGEEYVNAVNKRILSSVSERENYWRGRWNDLQSMNVLETEMLIWLHINETIYVHGRDKTNYMTVLYHEVESNCTSASRTLYDFAGLKWDHEIGTEAGFMENTLFRKMAPVDPAVAESISRAVDRFLPESALSELMA